MAFLNLVFTISKITMHTIHQHLLQETSIPSPPLTLPLLVLERQLLSILLADFYISFSQTACLYWLTLSFIDHPLLPVGKKYLAFFHISSLVPSSRMVRAPFWLNQSVINVCIIMASWVLLTAEPLLTLSWLFLLFYITFGFPWSYCPVLLILLFQYLKLFHTEIRIRFPESSRVSVTSCTLFLPQLIQFLKCLGQNLLSSDICLVYSMFLLFLFILDYWIFKKSFHFLP